MEAKTVRKEAREIQNRFFEALNTLIEGGKIKGLQTFCRDYDLHKPKYSRLRTATQDPSKESAYKFIDIDALGYLVKDYNISADWLLVGSGGMFKR
jgi:hypothetical protein